MMRYISTRGTAPVLTFGEAMMTGLARDGGLYVPETVPVMTKAEIAALRVTEIGGAARLQGMGLSQSVSAPDPAAAMAVIVATPCGVSITRLPRIISGPSGLGVMVVISSGISASCPSRT